MYVHVYVCTYVHLQQQSKLLMSARKLYQNNNGNRYLCVKFCLIISKYVGKTDGVTYSGVQKQIMFQLICFKSMIPTKRSNNNTY